MTLLWWLELKPVILTFLNPGWWGNLFIILGLWKVGNKEREAFLYTIVGEAMFAVYTGYRHDWPIFCAVLIFLILAIRNWWKWGQDGNA